jgi:hypothetical protein
MLVVVHCAMVSRMGPGDVFEKQPVKLNSTQLNLWSRMAVARSCEVRM